MKKTQVRTWLLMGALGVAIAGCSSGGSGGDGLPEAGPDPSAGSGADAPSEGETVAKKVSDAIPPVAAGTVRVGTQTLATEMTAPLLGTSLPEFKDRLFVVDQVGILWRINLTDGSKEQYLDVSSLLVPVGIDALEGYDERGFLGLAFHPQFATNGLMYTYTSEPVNGNADFTFPKLGSTCTGAPQDLAPDHQNVLREWTVTNPMDPASRPQATSRVVMRMDWGNYNHNGGMLAFGPDGLLYVSTGDGGGEDDQTCQVNGDKKPTIGHSPLGNSQDPRVIYGKMLRIDPTQRTSANGQYGVPADNPFVKDARYLPEIYALGLRNFWRFSFDTPTGALIGGDVGQITIEEVDVIRAGGNYGWRVKEGTAVFDTQAFELDPTGETDGIPFQLAPGYPEGLTDPIAQYGHEHDKTAQGSATIGGFVYRGTALPGLSGHYIFGDYSSSEEASQPQGRLFTLAGLTDDELRGTTPAQVHEVQSLTEAPIDLHVLGFAQDANGELYVLGNAAGIPKGQTGQVRRLVAP